MDKQIRQDPELWSVFPSAPQRNSSIPTWKLPMVSSLQDFTIKEKGRLGYGWTLIRRS